jgi:hypothetical protein
VVLNPINLVNNIINNNLENSLVMYQKVQSHYNIHKKILNTVPAIKMLQSELAGYINEVLGFVGKSNEEYTSKNTAEIQKQRNDLTIAILRISIAYSSWNYLSNKNYTEDRFDETMTMLNKRRDIDLYTYAIKLNSIAFSEVNNLREFGIEEADFNELANKAISFLALIQTSKIEVGLRASKLNQMTRLFEKTNKLLTTRLDDVMRAFMYSYPLIYDSYINARSLDIIKPAILPDYSGTLMPGIVTMVANIPYLSGRSFKIKNNGSDFLKACLSNKINELQGSHMVMLGGNNSQWLSSDFNQDTTANFLLLLNLSPLPLEYEVYIEE